MPMLNAVMLAMRLMQNRSRIPELSDLLERLQGTHDPLPASEHPIGSVSWLQESLNILNYGVKLEVDGDYGPATKQAVTDYQAAHDLTQDGWAGPDTVASIVSELEAHTATG